MMGWQAARRHSKWLHSDGVCVGKKENLSFLLGCVDFIYRLLVQLAKSSDFYPFFPLLFHGRPLALDKHCYMHGLRPGWG